MRELLADLGLTENEIAIYQMLLRDGASLAGKITQRTGIHRRNVYDCLERLVQKGLVAYIKENNQKVYSITNPKRIHEQFLARTRELEQILPAMQAQFNATHEKRETLFFRGAAGIKQVLQDQLSQKNEILVLATSVDVSDVIKHFFPKYQLLRAEANISTRMLFDARDRTQWNKLQRKLPIAKVRFAPDINHSAMSQYIYGDSVALIVWGADPIAILIRQKDIAKGFKNNFEFLWKMAKS